MMLHAAQSVRAPSAPAVLFEIRSQMLKKLRVMLAGKRLVGHPRFNVAQLHAVMSGEGWARVQQRRAPLQNHLNFFSSLDCKAAVREAARSTPSNLRRSDLSSTDAR